MENEETPLLDALGAKLGMSFTYILAPPVHQCLLCSKPLKKQHDPTNVALFMLRGPVVASRHIWRCRDCKCASLLSPSTEVADPSDVHYRPDSFGNPTVIFSHLYADISCIIDKNVFFTTFFSVWLPLLQSKAGCNCVVFQYRGLLPFPSGSIFLLFPLFLNRFF